LPWFKVKFRKWIARLLAAKIYDDLNRRDHALIYEYGKVSICILPGFDAQQTVFDEPKYVAKGVF
jgi:hypothetical protein